MSQIWPLGLFKQAPVFFQHMPSWFFQHFLNFWHHKNVPSSSCVFLTPRWSWPFSKEYCFLYWKVMLRNGYLTCRCAHCPWVSLTLSHPSRQNWINIQTPWVDSYTPHSSCPPLCLTHNCLFLTVRNLALIIRGVFTYLLHPRLNVIQFTISYPHSLGNTFPNESEIFEHGSFCPELHRAVDIPFSKRNGLVIFFPTRFIACVIQSPHSQVHLEPVHYIRATPHPGWFEVLIWGSCSRTKGSTEVSLSPHLLFLIPFPSLSPPHSHTCLAGD